MYNSQYRDQGENFEKSEDWMLVGCWIVLFFDIAFALCAFLHAPPALLIITGIPLVISMLVGLEYAGPLFIMVPIVLPIFGLCVTIWRLKYVRVNYFHIVEKARFKELQALDIAREAIQTPFSLKRRNTCKKKQNSGY